MRYLLIVLLLISCTNSRKINDSNHVNHFQEFVNRQKIIQLPIRIDLYKDYDGLVKPLDSDTSILNEKTEMWYLGLLEDTSRYYYVIPMYPGDDLCPFLYVFSKKGDLIDKARLYIGRYGADCGSHIYGYTTINKDLNIFTKDSLVQHQCDSTGNENKNSLTIYTNTQKMRILNSGKVKQEKEIEIIKKIQH